MDDDVTRLIRDAVDLRETTREFRTEADALWHEIGTSSITPAATRDLTRRITEHRQAEIGAHHRYLSREFQIMAKSFNPPERS